MTLQKIWILFTDFNYGFPKILKMNNDYFPTQHLLVGLCEGEALSCVCVCVCVCARAHACVCGVRLGWGWREADGIN